MADINTTLKNRFNSCVAKTEACWLWTRALHKGYGQLQVGGRKGKRKSAHRVAWELEYGDIPSGLSVLHHCDNPSCVNPLHLFLGTQSDNMLDMTQKGRRARGTDFPQAKLSDDDVRAIRQDGRILADIARDYQVSMSIVSEIRNNKRWLHVR